MTALKKISPRQWEENIVRLIGQDWMLVTAGVPDSFNTMTASWGGIGHLWNRPVAFVFVRPERYTYELMEREQVFTLSFFDPRYRPALTLLGTLSGRHTDKVAQSGLTPVPAENGGVTFAQARIVLECRKLYVSDLKEEGFLDRALLPRFYDAAHGGLHRVYVAEITDVYVE